MFPEGRALEFLLAAAIALVVVGPKDLPILMRKLGRFMAKMRGMAAEFRASFDEMARQSELDELRKEVEAMRSAQFADAAAHAGQAEAHEAFNDIRQSLGEAGAALNAPTTPPYFEAPSEPAAQPPAEPAAGSKPRARRASAKPATTAADDAKPVRRPRATKSPEPDA